MLNSSYKQWHKPNQSDNAKTHQGYYRIKNREKYIGDPNLAIYRSSWEFSFMRWCDNTASVLKWSSEPIKVPYYDRISKLEECKKLGIDPNNPKNWAVKNYNVDFWIQVDKGDNIVEKWFIEIKPAIKTKKPEPPKQNASLKETKRFNLAAKEYVINESKWAAMKEFAVKNNCKFYVFTEHVMERMGILGGQFDYDKETNKYQR